MPCKRLSCAVWLCLGWSLGSYALAQEPRALIVTTSGVEPYQLAAVAARKTVQERWPGSPAVISFDKTASPPVLPSGPDDVVIAVGSTAVQALASNVTGNFVGCMTLAPPQSATRKGVSTLVLGFPPESQIDWLRRILPTVRSIGVVYNPFEVAGRAEALAAVGKRHGLGVVLYAAGSPAELAAAADKAVAEVDVLMVLADSLMMSPQSAKQLLLSSFRNKVPLVGLSEPWVKAGALYALDWDFEDIGRQCGQMALRGTGGTSYPRVTRLLLNARTARYMKLDVPDAVVRQAARVFE